MKTQRANPGGILAPDDVVGRDELVGQLWKVLEIQSLYIVAERRMGKTSVVRDKMLHSKPEGWDIVYIDVSRAATACQFVEALVQDSHSMGCTGRRAKPAFRYLANTLSRLSVKVTIDATFIIPTSIRRSWKDLLISFLTDFSIEFSNVVLALDEFPLMLDGIRRRDTEDCGAEPVKELLDTLREERQKRNLRMIYTGSLGLHHIMTVLREHGYLNDPINDMYVVDLEPLGQSAAIELALRLLFGETIKCIPDEDRVANHIANVTNGIPYYIQHMVLGLSQVSEPASCDSVDSYLTQSLADSQDRWRLSYHNDRIDTHYPAKYRPISRAVLDRLALSEPMKLAAILDGIDPVKIERDAEDVRQVMNLLGLDHYTSFTMEDGYRFRSPFIRRVWRNIRQIGD